MMKIDRDHSEPTVTVGELRAIMADLPDDAKVLIWREDHPNDEELEGFFSGWAVKSARASRSIPMQLGLGCEISCFENDIPGSVPVLLIADMDVQIPDYEVTHFRGHPNGSHSMRCKLIGRAATGAGS